MNALGSALQQNFAALSASQQSAGNLVSPQMAQLLAGVISSEVVPLVKAELSGVLGPWLADSHAALRRLDTRLAVSCTTVFIVGASSAEILGWTKQ